VNQSPPVPAVRCEADDLRLRSNRLRERSRDLQQRSQLWRAWTPTAAHGAGPAGSLRHDDAREIQRLLRAETDLERVIGECKSALAEVRRELRGQDSGTPPVVH
jgi:anti-sigma-K factor RskA